MRKHNQWALPVALILLVAGPVAFSTGQDKSEQNKALARRVFDEIYSQGKLDLVDQLYADDFVDDSPGGGRGRAIIKTAVASFRKGAPDLRIDIEDIFAQDDKVVVRYTARGTHKGEIFGAAPTGKQITVRGITIFLISAGQVKVEWTEYDRLGLMRQLGLFPS